MRPYIDVHSHVGATISRVPPIGQTTAVALARMASGGVTAAIPSVNPGPPQAGGVADTRRQSEVISRACKRFPDRFPIGLAYAHVQHLTAGVEELDRSLDEDEGIVGFVIHPMLSGHGWGKQVHPFLEVVALAKGLVLLHADAASPEIAEYAQRFPDVTFMCGDPFTNRLNNAEEAKIPDNVFIDIPQYRSALFPDHPADNRSFPLDRIIKIVGSDRLLFGSDLPYADFRFVQQEIEMANISEEDKDRIAYKNSVGLIQRFKPGWELPSLPFDPPVRFTEEDLWAAQETTGSPPGYRLAPCGTLHL